MMFYRVIPSEHLYLFRNERELRWMWTVWRNRMSHTKELFRQLVNLQNTAARNNGNIYIINLCINQCICIMCIVLKK